MQCTCSCLLWACCLSCITLCAAIILAISTSFPWVMQCVLGAVEGSLLPLPWPPSCYPQLVTQLS